MSSELERELERALGEAPGPDPGVTDRALRSALEALPSPADARRIRRRRIALLLAACIAAFVSGGVTLAATDGRLPGIGPALTPDRPATSGAQARHRAATVAPGQAISALIGGRGVVVTARRTRAFAGPHLTGFAASPAALYAVEARPGHLRAVQVGTGRVAWRSRVAGTAGGSRVGAVPDPGRVSAPRPPRARGARHLGQRHARLHGARRRRSGRPLVAVGLEGVRVRPRRRRRSGARCDRRTRHGNPPGVRAAHRRGRCVRAVGRPARDRRPGRDICASSTPPATRRRSARRSLRGLPSIGWLGANQLVVGAGSTLSRIVIHRLGTGYDATATPGTVAGLAASPDGRRIVLALESGGRTRVVIAATPRFSEEAGPLRILRTLANRPGAGAVPLSWL